MTQNGRARRPTVDTVAGMTDLERLRAHASPRPTGLCLRYGLRHEGTFGYIAYAVLWAFLALPVALLPAVFLTPTRPAIGFVVGSLLSWAPFFAWMARRSAAGRHLIRHGTFVEGRIDEVTPGTGRAGGMASFLVIFEERGTTYRAQGTMFTGRGNAGILPVGARATVLRVEGDNRCGLFVYDDSLRMGVTGAPEAGYRLAAG